MRQKSIEQLGETRWRVFAQVNGRRKNKIVVGSERAARRELERMRVLMSGADYVDRATAPTVREAFDMFLPTQNDRVLKGEIGQSEYNSKERHARQFCEVKIGGLRVGDMKTTDLTSDLVIDEIVPKLQIGRVNRTVRKLIVNVQQAFDFFVRKRWCVQNAASGVKISTAGEGKNKRRITPAEMQFVISHAPAKYRLAIEFAAYTGLRQGEQRALIWDDIDFDDGVVHVRRAVKSGAGVGKTKTEAGERAVPLMDFLLQSLREWRVAQPIEQRGNGLVFPKRNGAVARGSAWRNDGIGAACKAANVERMTWLDLRHFYASVLIFSSELNDSTITEFLGHSSIAFSKKEYARWFKDRKRDEKIAAKLGAAFGR
tara:strand:- start:2954 stop:4069 length:1116 start_codon:yes stop_codon:yes gene_type:complete